MLFRDHRPFAAHGLHKIPALPCRKYGARADIGNVALGLAPPLRLLVAASVALAVLVIALPILNEAVGPVTLRHHVVVARGLAVLDLLPLLALFDADIVVHVLALRLAEPVAFAGGIGSKMGLPFVFRRAGARVFLSRC